MSEIRLACGEDVQVGEDASEEPGLDQPWVIPREYVIGSVRWFSDAVREMQRALHPLLAQIPRVELADMPRMPTGDEAPPAEASPLFRPMVTSHEWTVNVEDVVDFQVDQFLLDLVAMADETGAQAVRGFLEFVSDVSEEAGNVVSADGRDFFDVYADTLETIDMSFDESGTPQLTVILHPDQMAKLRDKRPTAEQQARINAIVDRRWEEWRAARRRRDLP